MFVRHCRQWWARLFSRRRQGNAVPARRRTRPRLEVLEDRTVPATIRVNSFLDGAVGPLIPDGADFRADNLRSAVAGANALPGDDSILLDAGTYQLNSDILRGPLTISDPSGGQLAIQGPAGGLSTIDPLQQSRLFNVDVSNTASFLRLRLQNGRDTSGSGGAVLNNGTLTLDRSVIANNVEAPSQGGFAPGGAVFNGFGSSLSVLTSTFLNNQALGGSSTIGFGGTAQGGAIFNSSSSSLTVRDSTFQDNHAVGGSASGGSFGNFAGDGQGGAIFFSGGEGSGSGSIVGSLFFQNSAEGGAVTPHPDYGGFAGDGTGGGLGVGGGEGGPTLDVFNSTFSDNDAIGGDVTGTSTGTLSAGDARGAGLFVDGGTTTLANVTVTLNDAAPGTGAAAASGGAVTQAAGGTVRVLNTISAQNTGTTPDVSGTFVDLGNNLIGDGTGGTGFTNGVNGDQVGGGSNPVLNAGLAPLAANGGPTLTHALLSGSLARDRGSNTVLGAPFNFTTDQRGPGFTRVFNGIVDVGAFEFILPPPPPPPPPGSTPPAVPPQLTLTNGVFAVLASPSQMLLLEFRLLARLADFHNEVGVILLDSSGRIDGLAPGDPGFVRHALRSGRRRILFRRRTRPIARRLLAVQGGQRFLVYIVQDSTTGALLRDNPGNQLTGQPLAFLTTRAGNPDGATHAHSHGLGANAFVLFMEDLQRAISDHDFNDVVLSVRLLSQ